MPAKNNLGLLICQCSLNWEWCVVVKKTVEQLRQLYTSDRDIRYRLVNTTDEWIRDNIDHANENDLAKTPAQYQKKFRDDEQIWKGKVNSLFEYLEADRDADFYEKLDQARFASDTWKAPLNAVGVRIHEAIQTVLGIKESHSS
jgi:hypothetical protein